MRRMIVLMVGALVWLGLSSLALAGPAPAPAKSTPAAAKMETPKAEKMESPKKEKAEEKAEQAMAKQPRHAMERVRLTKDEVTALQNALASAGDYKGKVDGVFGRHTRIALRKYQKANGLAVTGRVDSETATKLGITVAPDHLAQPSAASHKAAAKKS